MKITCKKCRTVFDADHRKRKYCSELCASMDRPKKTIEERFWAKVQKTDGCWLWTGSTRSHGYGQMNYCYLGNGVNIVRPPHRVSWEIHSGPIPDGICVCHKCDNPQCVNPDHLFLGTATDNFDDMRQKKRNPRGTKFPHARLNEESVRAIRQRWSAGGITQTALAREYGVSPCAISEVIRRKRWAHVA